MANGNGYRNGNGHNDDGGAKEGNGHNNDLLINLSIGRWVQDLPWVNRVRKVVAERGYDYLIPAASGHLSLTLIGRKELTKIAKLSPHHNQMLQGIREQLQLHLPELQEDVPAVIREVEPYRNWETGKIHIGGFIDTPDVFDEKRSAIGGISRLFDLERLPKLHRLEPVVDFGRVREGSGKQEAAVIEDSILEYLTLGRVRAFRQGPRNSN